jgi:hypothetical protein
MTKEERKARSIARESSISEMKKWLYPGDTVYCILRHRSASGMSRRISFITFANGRPLFWDGAVANILGIKLTREDGLTVRGAGMDMGAHVVGNLAHAMFGDERQLLSRWL